MANTNTNTKKYKPTTPGIRGTVIPLYRKQLSKGNDPLKRLTRGKKSISGRNAGKISVRHRGGGHKRLYREIDFKYSKKDIVGKIESVEYDPNRTSFISLVCYADGERKYILTPKDTKVGDKILTSEKAPIEPGNRLQLKNAPIGTPVYNIELKVDGGAKLVRSAGNSASVLGYDGKYSQIKLPSLEIRKVPGTCYASIGSVGNESHHLRVIGKAGRNRWMGRRPRVRGSAMNPVDHPHGGGEGRAGRGRRRAVTKWGKPSGKGQKTRKSKKYSNTSILKRRQLQKKR